MASFNEIMNLLIRLHGIFVQNPPTIKDLQEAVSTFTDKSDGMSSNNMKFAIESCDPTYFDDWTPIDVADVRRCVRVLHDFLGMNLMERLQHLLRKMEDTRVGQSRDVYKKIIQNLPLVTYLCYLYNCDKQLMLQLYHHALQNENSPARMILTIPGLVSWHMWKKITPEWYSRASIEQINATRTDDGLDTFISMFAPQCSRHDVRSILGNDFFFSFISDLIKKLMNRTYCNTNWLSFASTGQSIGTPMTIVSTPLSDWMYYNKESKYIESPEQDIVLRMRFVNVMFPNRAPTMHFSSLLSLRDLKAYVEKFMDEQGELPRSFNLYGGQSFPPLIIDNEDNTPLSELNLNKQLLIAKCF